MTMIRRILVATDFSPFADRALELALDIARREDASVTVLHACRPPACVAVGAGITPPPPDLMPELVANAERELRAIEDRLAARHFTVDVACIEGDPRDVIPRYAHEQRQDLVVVGSHGRRGFKRFLLGSVAESVVRTASVPVLVVHPTAAKDEQPAG